MRIQDLIDEIYEKDQKEMFENLDYIANEIQKHCERQNEEP